jgi:hypothetical protein
MPPAGDLPDYAAPFTSMTSDAEGNLWIREPRSTESVDGPVYELVNRAGQLFDRVRIPSGTAIEGFGPGVVYLSSREGTFESLVRVRIR